MGGWKARWSNGYMPRWIGQWMDGSKGGRVDAWVDGWIVGWMDDHEKKMIQCMWLSCKTLTLTRNHDFVGFVLLDF